MPFEKRTTEIPGWATSLEAISDFPSEEEDTFTIHLEEPPRFVVATLTLPNEQRPQWLQPNVSIRASNPNSEQRVTLGESAINVDDMFIDEQRTLFVINNPPFRDWRITLSNTSTPVALNVMAFHPSLRTRVRRFRLMSFLGQYKCGGCKTTAKALALAIIAAGTLPHLPAALIAAVASFLGVLKAAAAVFISAVIGDTIKVLTEKLCKRIGMCP